MHATIFYSTLFLCFVMAGLIRVKTSASLIYVCLEFFLAQVAFATVIVVGLARLTSLVCCSRASTNQKSDTRLRSLLRKHDWQQVAKNSHKQASMRG